MNKIIISIMLLLAGATGVWAQPEEEYWAREFLPAPNQVLTFNGLGDDGSVVSFITIYYARPKALTEPGYCISEYNIFPNDSHDPDFVPSVSVDYYLNEQGLWTRTPFEKSQGMGYSLLLPYKFSEGQGFAGRHGMEFVVLSVSKTIKEYGQIYNDCLELSNSDGDQLFYMPEVGLVLSRGNNEQWMVKRERFSPEKIRATYRLP